jgi:DNA polymerase (family 10)
VPIHNNEIADIFNHVADLLDIEGANQFRIRAYRGAARTIADLPRSAVDMVKREEGLSSLLGIGKDPAGRIKEVVETGTLA